MSEQNKKELEAFYDGINAADQKNINSRAICRNLVFNFIKDGIVNPESRISREMKKNLQQGVGNACIERPGRFHEERKKENQVWDCLRDRYVREDIDKDLKALSTETGFNITMDRFGFWDMKGYAFDISWGRPGMSYRVCSNPPN